MRRYRTEVQVPADGTLWLQLPAYLPPGRAIVTVEVLETDHDDAPGDADPDRQDIEWWEEFDDEEAGRPS